MPIALPPRPARAPARESFLFKSMLVVSALVIGCLIVVNAEFSFSAPAHSLSEAEAALRLGTK